MSKRYASKVLASIPEDESMGVAPPKSPSAAAEEEHASFVAAFSEEAKGLASRISSILDDPACTPAKFELLNMLMTRLDELVEVLYETPARFPMTRWEALVMAAELYGDGCHRRPRQWGDQRKKVERQYRADRSRVPFRGEPEVEKPFFDLDGGEDDDEKEYDE